MNCRCCGNPVRVAMDAFPIHTACIGKHWGNHAHGISASRCKEFSKAKPLQRRTVTYVPSASITFTAERP